MKLLLDHNLSPKLLKRIRPLFPGSMQVDLLGLRRASDNFVFLYAIKNEFVIVTKDADYMQLNTSQNCKVKVVWLRIGNAKNDYIASLLNDSFDKISAFYHDDHKFTLEIY